ncbi:hypothetical protein [Actinoplanes xinjiangensis]|uniref:Uncharacterized protein n=1 Tax=Actinoplanes xinjiangensis TaxID=512350 RepID=A0A316ESJ7_9ACTN|nr:hypothetical protein [Actinoplanes xinjiangensis]PWK26120.1 hypothetical protein BC793_1672 [Actinoplanes xinjiangensis]GIF45440.1 hypothetical protein Axi01nite_97510 [Actinoplanes xinjiangensis]
MKGGAGSNERPLGEEAPHLFDYAIILRLLVNPLAGEVPLNGEEYFTYEQRTADRERGCRKGSKRRPPSWRLGCCRLECRDVIHEPERIRALRRSCDENG